MSVYRRGMAWVVFLRAANVGGSKVFQPSAFARSMAHLKMENIGAAGTFIVNGPVGVEALRKELIQKLPVQTHLMICAGQDVMKLVKSRPFGAKPPAKEIGWFVTILDGSPGAKPRLPYRAPGVGAWELNVMKMVGPFVLTERRLGGKLYPNEAVEKLFKSPGTTRGWPTLETIVRKLPPHI